MPGQQKVYEFGWNMCMVWKYLQGEKVHLSIVFSYSRVIRVGMVSIFRVSPNCKFKQKVTKDQALRNNCFIVLVIPFCFCHAFVLHADVPLSCWYCIYFSYSIPNLHPHATVMGMTSWVNQILSMGHPEFFFLKLCANSINVLDFEVYVAMSSYEPFLSNSEYPLWNN